MNVLVTGGTGFVGAHLTEALLRRGHRVVVFDDLSRPGAAAVARSLNDTFDSTARLSFVFRDVRDASEIGRAAAGVDAVFHGAVTGTDDAVALDAPADLQVRVGGTLAILEALRVKSPRAHLLIPSSAAVYGAAPVIAERMVAAATERSRTSPGTAAGAAALAAEAYALACGASYGLRVTVLRFAALYGGEDLVEDEGWVGRLVRASAFAGRFVAPCDLPFAVDLLHVSDAVSAVRAILEMPGACAGQVFNVGAGQSAPRMVEMIARVRELGGRPRFVPPDASVHPGFVLDARKLRLATGWQPAVGWRDGIARALAAQRLGNLESKAVVAWPLSEGLA